MGEQRKEDVSVDRYLDALDLGIDIEDMDLDRRQISMLASLRRLVLFEGRTTRALIEEREQANRLEHQTTRLDNDKTRRLIRKLGRTLMADLSGINEALAALSTEISQLADQVAALNAGTVTQDELDQVASDIRAAAASVDAIVEPDAGEEPPVEPAP
jgi:hypothetical protein